MSDLFGVWLERGAFTLGETVTGKVVFPDPSHQGLAKVKAVKVVVHARVHGSGNSERVVAFEQVLSSGPVTAPELPFGARLPDRGPLSFQGRHVKVNWEVVAELDIPWAIDPKKVLPFTVGPRPAP